MKHKETPLKVAGSPAPGLKTSSSFVNEIWIENFEITIAIPPSTANNFPAFRTIA